MITKYRCPSCYTEFENSAEDSKCERCGIDAFQIGQKEEAPVVAENSTEQQELPNTANEVK